jgi:fructokinase
MAPRRDGGDLSPIRIGIDLGGSKIEVVAMDNSGQELLRRRIPTPQGDYAAILNAIVELVHHTETQTGTDCTIGVGTPGALSRATGKLKNSNSTCLNGTAILDDLERLIGRPVRMSNDANCFALSEAIDGSGAKASVIFGVIAGTGCGAGIVINGSVLTGLHGVAGEWGHNPLPWATEEERPGPDCYCGKKGCIETYLSGPGMARDHRISTGRKLRPETIVQRASSGDAASEATMARYEDRMARALAHVINILDPDVIVLGGGMSNIARLYENVPKLWGRYVFSDVVETKLLPARHGDSSGVRGAAWLWSAGMQIDFP